MKLRWKNLKQSAKGQMKSECIYEIINFPKYQSSMNQNTFSIVGMAYDWGIQNEIQAVS